jgi:OFA family oxalate/formate antiporter-like MFS transporter
LNEGDEEQPSSWVRRLDTSWSSFAGDLRGRALWVIVGCLICQMGLGFGYVLNPLAKDILAELGWSRAELSAARLPQLLVMSLASPLVGMLTVRLGARRILMVSAGLLGVCFAVLSTVESLWAYYALFLLLGLALTGVGDITVGQVVAEWVERGRGMALGIVYVGSNLGGVLLVPIAVGVADQSSWRDAILVLSGCAIFVLLPAAAFLVRSPEEGEGRRAREHDAGSGESLAGAHDLDLRAALRTPTFWLLFFSLLTFFFYFLAILEHLVLFLSDEGMSRKDAAAAYALALGLGIWSKLGLGILADRIPEKASLLLDYGLLAVSSIVLLALPHDSLLWVFVATYGISVAARDVVYPLIVTRCFGVSHMAEIYGVLMLTLVLGGGLGPFFAASVHDSTGSYDLAFQTFAVLNVASVLGLAFVRDERGVSA